MKGMFLKKFYIYYQKCATVAQRFQLSMTKLGACDEIRWNDGTVTKPVTTVTKKTKIESKERKKEKTTEDRKKTGRKKYWQ